jgi:two-component system KDP operon response regulator KdpE
MDRASTVVPTAALLHEVWGYNDAAAREVLRVTLYRLRRKLEDDPSAPRLLHTVPGVGVMLKVAAVSQQAATVNTETLS